ncbi:MAG TPA: hypothetical protein VKZ50_13640 [bacterium]|nr:hypothetical protein [bacterium]
MVLIEHDERARFREMATPLRFKQDREQEAMIVMRINGTTVQRAFSQVIALLQR